MEIRWQQYQVEGSPEGKAQALETYRYWQGQLSERQDNDNFAEEVTTPMALAAWTSAAAGPVAAEFTAVKALLAVAGVMGGASEIKEGSNQGGQLGTARVVGGVATILSSVSAMLPEGIKAFRWLRGKLSGERPAAATVVESRSGPGTTAEPVPASTPGPRSLGAETAMDSALVVRRESQTRRNVERRAPQEATSQAPQPEVVQRAMSVAELQATKATGLLRGGRSGTHYVSDTVNSDALRARQRLALGQTPEVRATLEVPEGVFSTPTKVAPLNGMPGGGTERTATGPVQVKVIREDSY